MVKNVLISGISKVVRNTTIAEMAYELRLRGKSVFVVDTMAHILQVEKENFRNSLSGMPIENFGKLVTEFAQQCKNYVKLITMNCSEDDDVYVLHNGSVFDLLWDTEKEDYANLHELAYKLIKPEQVQLLYSNASELLSLYDWVYRFNTTRFYNADVRAIYDLQTEVYSKYTNFYEFATLDGPEINKQKLLSVLLGESTTVLASKQYFVNSVGSATKHIIINTYKPTVVCKDYYNLGKRELCRVITYKDDCCKIHSIAWYFCNKGKLLYTINITEGEWFSRYLQVAKREIEYHFTMPNITGQTFVLRVADDAPSILTIQSTQTENLVLVKPEGVEYMSECVNTVADTFKAAEKNSNALAEDGNATVYVPGYGYTTVKNAGNLCNTDTAGNVGSKEEVLDNSVYMEYYKSTRTGKPPATCGCNYCDEVANIHHNIGAPKRNMQTGKSPTTFDCKYHDETTDKYVQEAHIHEYIRRTPAGAIIKVRISRI